MATPEEQTENPQVKLLVKSKNAEENGGFLKKEFPYEQAKKLLGPEYRGRFKLDPKEKNYKWNGSDLIRQSGT